MLRYEGSSRVVQPQMLMADIVVGQVFEEHNLTCVMTSGYREKGSKSLHPYGYARDYDTVRTLQPFQWEDIRREVQERLGVEYDVLAHDAGSGMHLHVEYDPR